VEAAEARQAFADGYKDLIFNLNSQRTKLIRVLESIKSTGLYTTEHAEVLKTVADSFKVF